MTQREIAQALGTSNVIPYWKRSKDSVILSRQQYASGIVVDFNGANCLPSEQVACEYSATSACEKCQLIHSART